MLNTCAVDGTIEFLSDQVIDNMQTQAGSTCISFCSEEWFKNLYFSLHKTVSQDGYHYFFSSIIPLAFVPVELYLQKNK